VDNINEGSWFFSASSATSCWLLPNTGEESNTGSMLPWVHASGRVFSRPHRRAHRDNDVDAIGCEFLREYRESGRSFCRYRPYNFDVEIIATALIA
jgi:hypothetical protein